MQFISFAFTKGLATCKPSSCLEGRRGGMRKAELWGPAFLTHVNGDTRGMSVTGFHPLSHGVDESFLELDQWSPWRAPRGGPHHRADTVAGAASGGAGAGWPSMSEVPGHLGGRPPHVNQLQGVADWGVGERLAPPAEVLAGNPRYLPDPSSVRFPGSVLRVGLTPRGGGWGRRKAGVRPAFPRG